MSFKTSVAIALLCLAPLGMVTGAAFAQTAPAASPAQTAPAPATAAAPEANGPKRGQACQADIQKFCATVEKVKGAMRACLDSHTAELSDGCKTARAERAAKEAAAPKDTVVK